MNPRRATPRPLLEREEQLAALQAAYDAAKAGSGQLVFIEGEAGVGKTTLVRQFAARPPEKSVVLGACDPLETPRPLGPVLDMAPDLSRRAAEAMPGSASREELFAFMVRALDSTGDCPLLVFEDLHWGDQATVDLLRHLGRRLDRVRALVLATLREHEVLPRSPVALLLGDLATVSGVARLAVPPLSERATALMVAGSGLQPGAVYELTGGNPFFIGEVIGVRSESVPPTVRDAVLARVSRLSNAAREALEAAAGIGSRVQPSLLWAVLEATGTPRWGIHEAVTAGFLVWRDDSLAFRHELALSAIADATDPARRQQLHVAILAELRRGPLQDDALAGLVRHAEAAGDDACVLELAPAAAERAAALSAHREAATLLAKAIQRSWGLAPGRQAELLERQAREYQLGSQLEAAVAVHESAARVRAGAGDAEGQAANLSRVSFLRFLGGQYAAAETARATALRILEALPPGRELALACEATARQRFMEFDLASAAEWAERARAVAAGAGDEELALEAEAMAAAARLAAGQEVGRRQLEVALEAARGRRLEDLAARITLYLGWLPMVNRDYERVDERLAEGLAYAIDHQLGYWELLIASARVRWALDQGHWHGLEEQATRVLKRREAPSPARLPALAALARLKARRADPDAAGLLDEALEMISEHHRLEAVSLVWPARAEAAWLTGDLDGVRAAAGRAMAGGWGAQSPWWHGELAFWVHAAGGSPAPAIEPARPYALSLAGDWAAAARWWLGRGCPYEAALARLLAPDADQLLAAVRAFDQLGARPAADHARRRLRDLGVQQVPRGPRASTLGNQAGLTRREQDVLQLVAGGLSNREIAGRLFLSPKTVERHLSGIMRKLDAGSRLEAVAAAGDMGLIPPSPN